MFCTNFYHVKHFVTLSVKGAISNKVIIIIIISPHSILGLEKNVLWVIGMSLNQSQSSWAVLSAAQSNGTSAK